MVTERKLIDHIMWRYRLGTFLVWLGVLAWVPFIFLRAIGEKPAFLLFLPIHLIGVVGGSRIRSAARKELHLAAPKKSFLTILGHLMIFLGILVWAPYLYLKIVLGRSLDVLDFLPYHLTGVFSGVLLHLLNWVRQKASTDQN